MRHEPWTSKEYEYLKDMVLQSCKHLIDYGGILEGFYLTFEGSTRSVASIDKKCKEILSDLRKEATECV